MHCKSELYNSTVDWKQGSLRRSFSYKASRVSSTYKSVLTLQRVRLEPVRLAPVECNACLQTQKLDALCEAR